jgi:hypothetical protein
MSYLKMCEVPKLEEEAASRRCGMVLRSSPNGCLITAAFSGRRAGRARSRQDPSSLARKADVLAP